MAWTWSMWADIAALLGILGVGARQQRLKGIQEEKMKEMARQLASQDILITAHTAALAQHEGSFKVIDTKLDYISKAVDKLGDCK